MTRIFILEEGGLFRAGLRTLLNSVPGFRVVGETGDWEQARRLCLSTRPDVILLELGMTGIDASAAAHWLRSSLPAARLIGLSNRDDRIQLASLLQSGVMGCLPKQAGEEELIQAIHDVSANEFYIHPSLVQKLMKPVEPVLSPAETSSMQSQLTAREKDVLRLIVLGYTNRQVASALTIGVRTVETHRARLMSKLGLHSRADLVRFAMQNRLFVEPEPRCPKAQDS